jgi:hypothetical protein
MPFAARKQRRKLAGRRNDGYGGLHCLIPQPKHILIDRDENGILATEVFFRTSQECP